MRSRWILCPLANESEITARQNTIEFFQQPQTIELARSVKKELQRIADIPKIVKKILAYQCVTTDWLRFIDSILAVLEVGRLLQVMLRYASLALTQSIIERTTIPELIELAPSLLRGEEISRFSFFLQQVFDLKQSAETKEMYVREGVDPSLDTYRTIQHDMLNILDECSVATKQRLLEHFPDLARENSLDEWEYVFMPRSRSRWATLTLSRVFIRSALGDRAQSTR